MILQSQFQYQICDFSFPQYQYLLNFNTSWILQFQSRYFFDFNIIAQPWDGARSKVKVDLNSFMLSKVIKWAGGTF